jgi:hypothetical protein
MQVHHFGRSKKGEKKIEEIPKRKGMIQIERSKNQIIGRNKKGKINKIRGFSQKEEGQKKKNDVVRRSLISLGQTRKEIQICKNTHGNRFFAEGDQDAPSPTTDRRY